MDMYCKYLIAFRFVCFFVVIQKVQFEIQIFEKNNLIWDWVSQGLACPESRAVFARHIYSLFVYKVISVVFLEKEST